METIKNALKSGYFQFVSFIRDMPVGWFLTIWLGLLALSLVFIMKFFKEYNGTQKQFVKVSMVILSVVCIACLVFITYIR